MSYLARFFSTRRAYSSFFSSKPGGGRYFNSTKPPKPAGVSHKGNSISDATSTETQVKSDSQSTESTQAEESNGKGLASTPPESPPAVLASLSSLTTISPSATHPALSRNDLRLHQFFSLHRPLILLSNPDSILASGVPHFNPFHRTDVPAQPSSLEDPLQSFQAEEQYDLDAEAARQLSRALSMTNAASTVAWEDTLRHLGLDMQKDVGRVEAHRQLTRDWEQVQMDSVKRKRRKKMKKHKYKKRRKATRFERLRLKQG